MFYQGDNVSSRVRAMQGDIELPGLGLSDEDEATLSSQVYFAHISFLSFILSKHSHSHCLSLKKLLWCRINSFFPLSHRLRWSYTAQQLSDLTRTSVQRSAWMWVIWRIPRMIRLWSVRLGLLLPSLISPTGCSDCKQLFMSPLHTPTVTGQHPTVLLQITFEWTVDTIKTECLRSHTDEEVYPAPAPPRKYVSNQHSPV